MQLIDCWKKALSEEVNKPYLKQLREFLQSEKSKKMIYPRPSEYFTALNTTPIDQVKVVLLGQDPYHGPNQAHGLSFSVRPKVAIPPSLQNIYKELRDDIGFEIPKHGYLLPWADQGVLLLNATLTVEARSPGSHQNKGWEEFTDKILQVINDREQPAVFFLWGAYAQKKAHFLDDKKHLVLKARHPSPFSAHKGFFGCKHFSKANAFLEKNGQAPISWTLPQLVDENNQQDTPSL